MRWEGGGIEPGSLESYLHAVATKPSKCFVLAIVYAYLYQTYIFLLVALAWDVAQARGLTPGSARPW